MKHNCTIVVVVLSVSVNTFRWREGGVLFSVNHTDHAHTHGRTYEEHIAVVGFSTTTQTDTQVHVIPASDALVHHTYLLSALLTTPEATVYI